MEKRFQAAFAAVMMMQPSLAAAAECPPNFQLIGPYWVMAPISIATPLVVPGGNSDQNILTILLTAQTLKAGDGTTGCIGSVVLRKGLAAATLNNPAPPQPSCASTGPAGGTLFQDMISASVTNTFIGRLPLSLQSAAGNRLANYDYRIIISKAVVSSVCYSPVGANGASELWDGRS